MFPFSCVSPGEVGSISESIAAPTRFIGIIEAVIGGCTLMRSGGTAVQIRPDDRVCEGDSIETSDDGHLCIRLIDGPVLRLSSNAHMRLSEFACAGVVPLHVARGSCAFIAGAIAKTGRFNIETPLAGVRRRFQSGGFGFLPFAGLILASMKEVHAASSGISFLDDGTITYKDLEHGLFELVTKEATPRHIFVDDPGETIVLRRVGSSISESHVTNSVAQMAQFEAAQQEALHIFLLGLQGPTATGRGGSGTPPAFEFPSFIQPINFIRPDNGTQHFTILDNAPGAHGSTPPADIFLIPPLPPAPPGSVVERVNVTGDTAADSATGTLALSGENFSKSLPIFVWSGGSLTTDQINALKAESTLTVTPSDAGTANVNFSAPDKVFDFLAAGETLTITYEVTATGTNTVTATLPVTITIIGTNDAPMLAVDASDQHRITELAHETNDPMPDAVSGSLQFADADLNDTHTVGTSAVSVDWSAGGTLPEGLENVLSQAFSATELDSKGSGAGSIDFKFCVPDRDFDFLAQGETLTVTYDVTVTDDHGVSSTQPVAFTVYGSEDKPVIISGAQSASVIEDADHDPNENTEIHSSSGLIRFRDVDLSDTETSSITGEQISASLANGYTLTDAQANALLGAFTIDAATHSAVDGTGTITWHYDIGDGALDFLGTDDQVTLTYTVQVSDGHGGYASQDVVIAVHGTEDAPVIQSGNQSGLVTEDIDNTSLENNETHHQSDSIAFNDVDLSDNETQSIVDQQISATLANGDTLTDAQKDKLLGAFKIDPATHLRIDGSGTIDWHYDIADSDLDFLGAKDQVTLTYTVQVSDGHGGFDSRNAVITVHGTEDAPIITSATSNALTELPGTGNPDTRATSGTISFTDVDLSDRPTVTTAFDSFSYKDAHDADLAPLSAAQVTAVEALEAQLQLSSQAGNTNDGSVTWTYSVADQALDFLAQNEKLTLTYTAIVDDHQNGGVVTSPFTVTITGTNDVPTIAATDASVWEQPGTDNPGDDVAAGTITFADVDLSDRPAVTAAFAQYSDSSGRVLTDCQKATLEAALAIVPDAGNANDGSATWTYTVPDNALDFLAQDETLALTYTATVNDGNGGIASQPITVVLHGTNDAPVLQLTGAYILDQFATQDYGAWIEQNDDFRAHNGSPTEGDFQIAHDPTSAVGDLQIRLTDLDAEVGPPDLLSRTVDLSGATSAVLTFDYRRDIPHGDADDKFFVLASDDGVNFKEIGQIGATGDGSFVDDAYHVFTFDLTPYISADTTIRFSVGDDVDDGDVVYVDNFKVAYTNAAPSDDLAVNYTENSAVGVFAQITDVDNTTMQSATITLTNHQASDLLTVIGSLPGAITASDYDASTGVLTLTGSASLSDYQTALQQVVFSNGSDDPNAVDRTLTITVNDGIDDSHTTTTTIHVTPIDDAPTAVDDNVITNINFDDHALQIPVSALIANDSDPDNALDQLSISNVGPGSDGNVSLGNGVINFTDEDSDGSFNYTLSDGSLSANGHVTISGNMVGTLSGTDQGEILIGKSSGSTINGNGGNDVLIGNAGADTLNGGSGADTMTGGGGNDTFVFKAITDSLPGSGHFDTITDFIGDSDLIDLSAIAGANSVQGQVSTANTVEAQHVSWFVDTAHDETIVYVNASATPNHVDMEIHLVGTNLHLTDANIVPHV